MPEQQNNKNQCNKQVTQEVASRRTMVPESRRQYQQADIKQTP
jgi:hypothetical protein